MTLTDISLVTLDEAVRRARAAGKDHLDKKWWRAMIDKKGIELHGGIWVRLGEATAVIAAAPEKGGRRGS